VRPACGAGTGSAVKLFSIPHSALRIPHSVCSALGMFRNPKSQMGGTAIANGRLTARSPRRLLSVPYRIACALGVDPLRMIRGLADVPRFVRTAVHYRRARRETSAFGLALTSLYPCFGDWRETAASVGGHYFYQDLWAAQKICCVRPTIHLDIGSRIDGFVAHLLCFMPVTVVDIRPLPLTVEGLTFIEEDATSLKQFADSSLESISSLHAVEHFGLGRYGDPVNPDAPFEVMDSLARVLRPGGRLYFSVPIGRQRLEFNAHRVFSPSTILKAFSSLGLVSFSAVTDRGEYLTDAEPDTFADAWYACGLFEFTKCLG